MRDSRSQFTTSGVRFTGYITLSNRPDRDCLLAADHRPLTTMFVPPNIRLTDDELKFTFVRSSGPGGQNVNKVNSKAVLRWNVLASPGLPDAARARFLSRFGARLTEAGDLLVTSQRFRDQKRNEEDCLEKLRAMLAAVAHPPKRRRKTKPTRASIERRKEQKRETSHKKQGRRWQGDE